VQARRSEAALVPRLEGADGLAAGHVLAGRHRRHGWLIRRAQTVGMSYRYHGLASHGAGEGNHAGTRGEDGLAGPAAEVDAAMPWAVRVIGRIERAYHRGKAGQRPAEPAARCAAGLGAECGADGADGAGCSGRALGAGAHADACCQDRAHHDHDQFRVHAGQGVGGNP
jgi:hypothetical protein